MRLNDFEDVHEGVPRLLLGRAQESLAGIGRLLGDFVECCDLVERSQTATVKVGKRRKSNRTVVIAFGIFFPMSFGGCEVELLLVCPRLKRQQDDIRGSSSASFFQLGAHFTRRTHSEDASPWRPHSAEEGLLSRRFLLQRLYPLGQVGARRQRDQKCDGDHKQNLVKLITGGFQWTPPGCRCCEQYLQQSP